MVLTCNIFVKQLKSPYPYPPPPYWKKYMKTLYKVKAIN